MIIYVLYYLQIYMQPILWQAVNSADNYLKLLLHALTQNLHKEVFL